MMNLKEKIVTGQPIDDFRIIDCHNHMGRWQAFFIPQHGTADQMVHCMDMLGIDQVFVTAHASIGPDYIYGNNMVIDAVKKYPDRIYGYVTVNPNYVEDMTHELDRCLSIPGFRGIKLHPGCHGRPIDYKLYEAAYRRADDHKLPILIHVWGIGDVNAVEHLSAEYPNARFIMGHFGADVPGMTHAIDVINKRDNVYGDTALSTALEGQLEWLVSETNPKRIVFGTDMPFLDPRPTLGRVALADIPDETRIDIFGRNIASALGISY